MYSNLPKFTQLKSGRDGIQTQIYLIPKFHGLFIIPHTFVVISVQYYPKRKRFSESYSKNYNNHLDRKSEVYKPENPVFL